MQQSFADEPSDGTGWAGALGGVGVAGGLILEAPKIKLADDAVVSELGVAAACAFEARNMSCTSCVS
jgi:hypothetical protein